MYGSRKGGRRYGSRRAGAHVRRGGRRIRRYGASRGGIRL